MSRTASAANLILAAFFLVGLGCSDPSGPTSTENDPPSAENSTRVVEKVDSEGLKALFTKLQEAIRAADLATAAAITKDLLPDDSSLAKAVKSGPAIAKIKAMHSQFATASDEKLAGLLATDPGRTEILVHAATTEEIIAYQEGGVAYAEFPGGAKAAAETALQPGMTFYEVELVEPGKDLGMKYHLFYHDGENWKMLGPVWRALR